MVDLKTISGYSVCVTPMTKAPSKNARSPATNIPFVFTPENIKNATHVLDDFGFEVRVEQVLKKHCKDVHHGGSYRDSVMGKPRQFDLRAILKNASVSKVFRFAIECKNFSPACPLIVSCTPRTKDESFHDLVFGNPAYPGLARVENSMAYPEGRSVGRNLTRIRGNPSDGTISKHSEKENDLYDGWAQALASSAELCQTAATATDENGNQLLSFIMPILVVPDDVLWIVEYSRTGTVTKDPYKSDSAEVFINHSVDIFRTTSKHYLSHIHVFTVSGLRRFIDEQLESVYWDDFFSGSAMK